MFLKNNIKKQRKEIASLLFLFSIFYTNIFSQVNLVNNPSFEDYYDCNNPVYLSKAKYWNSIDSAALGYGAYFNVCNFLVPNNGYSKQYPRTGNAYMSCTEIG